MAAVGLTGVLASCGGVEVTIDPGIISNPVLITPTNPGTGITPVSNLQLLSYQSEYTLPTAYTDTKTGATYAKGSSVICDNLNTRMSVDVDFSGTINRFGVRLDGRDTPATGTIFSGPLGNIQSSNPTRFEFTLGNGVAPLSLGDKLKAQAIVVTPVNTFTVKGATFVSVQAMSADGTLSEVVDSVQAIPVADCTR
ncbi:hypothetical protein GCM10008949_26280 [Deinococcus humi]|nr:hypothetical protein GCM10008949_26280 [Deinococcus humi]